MNKEIATLNNYALSEIPTDNKKLAPFISIATKAVEAEKAFLKTLAMQPKKYQEVLKSAQKHAFILLQAELRLANILRGIQTQRGLRTDLEKKLTQRTLSQKKILLKQNII